MWMVLFDALAEFSLISLPVVLTFSGLTIPMFVCFCAEAYGPLAQQMALWMMMFVGLDRLHAVLFPIHYKNSLKLRQKYLGIGFVIAAIVTMSQVYLYYQGAKADPDKPVFCMPTDFMSNLELMVAMNIVLSLNIVTFLVYLLIWALITCKVVPTLSNSATERRVLRSLFLLMAIVFCCWFPSSSFIQLVLPLFQLSPNTQNVLFRFALQFSKIAQAVNAPVLYASSVDYRCAMRKEIAKWLTFCCHRQTQIGIVEPRMNRQIMDTSAGISNNVQQIQGRPMSNNYM